jgi:hypothetical protein
MGSGLSNGEKLRYTFINADGEESSAELWSNQHLDVRDLEKLGIIKRHHRYGASEVPLCGPMENLYRELDRKKRNGEL